MISENSGIPCCLEQVLHLKRGNFYKRRRAYLSKYSNPQLIHPEYHRYHNQVSLQKINNKKVYMV